MGLFYSAEQDVIADEMEDSRLVLRPAEISELLDLHPNTVYRLLKSGKLPASKVGGCWRICKKDLIGFIQKYPDTCTAIRHI